MGFCTTTTTTTTIDYYYYYYYYRRAHAFNLDYFGASGSLFGMED